MQQVNVVTLTGMSVKTQIPNELKNLLLAFESGVDCGFSIRDFMVDNNIFPK